jgi:hypothetical protein
MVRCLPPQRHTLARHCRTSALETPPRSVSLARFAQRPPRPGRACDGSARTRRSAAARLPAGPHGRSRRHHPSPWLESVPHRRARCAGLPPPARRLSSASRRICSSRRLTRPRGVPSRALGVSAALCPSGTLNLPTSTAPQHPWVTHSRDRRAVPMNRISSQDRANDRLALASLSAPR